MWILKPHYYGSHFYNWPYTYGLLFGLGLFATYRDDPERFRGAYDDLLSRAGTDTAEELAALFDLDGVLTPTAKVHEAAWAKMFNGFLERREGPEFEPFTEQDYLTYVDGKPDRKSVV